MEIRHRAGRVCGWSGFGGMAAWAGAVLGGVRMVSAMALAGMPLGSCVVFISGIRSGSSGSWLMGWRDFWCFSRAPSCLLFYLVYGYYSNLPFLSYSYSF